MSLNCSVPFCAFCFLCVFTQIGSLKEKDNYYIKDATVCSYAGLKYLSFGESSVAESFADIGEVNHTEVGDREATDFVAARTIEGEVEAIEYFESFVGCFKCNAKVPKNESVAECPKCGILRKVRSGCEKLVARVVLRDNTNGALSTATMFEQEIENLTNGVVGKDMKLKLLAAPQATFKIDSRNIVVGVDFSV